jgi:hypothetical protein
MSLKLNGATSGYVEIDAPAVAGSTSITLPATSGGEFVVTDSSGRVGIGTSTLEGAKLQVSEASSGASASSNSDTLFLENNGQAGITIGTPNNTIGQIRFADPENDTAGRIAYEHNNDAMSFNVNNLERLRIDSSGRLLVGKTSSDLSTAGVEVRAGASSSFIIGKSYSGTVNGLYFHHNSTYVGGLNYTNTGTSLATSSDYRLKENVVAVPNAIARVNQLNPIQFNFIAEPDETVEGFIAHELGEVVPEACFGKKDAVDENGNIKPQSIAQEKLIPLLTAALQEALAKIETLEQRLSDAGIA